MISHEDKLSEIAHWLLISALTEKPICETFGCFAERLLDCGIPVHRINGSTFQRHQIMGAVDTAWEQDFGVSDTEFVPKSEIMDSRLNNTPAGSMARGCSDFERYNLRNMKTRQRFQIFEDLRTRGFSDYLLIKQSYGRH